jgi:hypothetical protein
MVSKRKPLSTPEWACPGTGPPSQMAGEVAVPCAMELGERCESLSPCLSRMAFPNEHDHVVTTFRGGHKFK